MVDENEEEEEGAASEGLEDDEDDDKVALELLSRGRFRDVPAVDTPPLAPSLLLCAEVEDAVLGVASWSKMEGSTFWREARAMRRAAKGVCVDTTWSSSRRIEESRRKRADAGRELVDAESFASLEALTEAKGDGLEAKPSEADEEDEEEMDEEDNGRRYDFSDDEDDEDEVDDAGSFDKDDDTFCADVAAPE